MVERVEEERVELRRQRVHAVEVALVAVALEEGETAQVASGVVPSRM